MKKYIVLLILIIFCFGFSSPHSRIIARKNATGGSETPQEAGYSTVGSSESATSNDRCALFTVGATQLTVSYAYFYGNYNGTGNDLTFAVYTDSGSGPGSQVGSCSDGGDLPQSASAAWHERTWSSGDVVLSATTNYYICRYNDTDVDEFYDSPGGTQSYYAAIGPGGCPADMTSTSTRKPTMTVSNYDAH